MTRPTLSDLLILSTYYRTQIPLSAHSTQLRAPSFYSSPAAGPTALAAGILSSDQPVTATPPYLLGMMSHCGHGDH